MKTFTKHQKLFAGIALLATLVFFSSLQAAIDARQWETIRWWAIGYAATLFLSGLVLGYSDQGKQRLYNTGFRYHWITFVIVSSIQLIGVVLPFTAFQWKWTWPALVAWGLGLMIHYLASRQSINNYSAEELFE